MMRGMRVTTLLLSLLGMTGCGLEVTPVVQSVGAVGTDLSGVVMGGSVALAGASVSLLEAGVAGNGSGGAVLARTTADATGRFDFAAAAYRCSSADRLLLVVAEAADRAEVVLMSAPGMCGSAAAKVTVNELSTVASVWALRPFLSASEGQGPVAVGSSATNGSGLGQAWGVLQELVEVGAGTVPGSSFPANGKVPAAKIDALANALHGCVAAVSGCAGLFAAAGKVSTTLGAALAIVSSPGLNGAAVWSQAQANPFFQPMPMVAPADWTLPLIFAGGGLSQPTALAFNSGGQLWVANNGGAASLFTHAGAPVFASGISGFGLQACYGGAVDQEDRFWVVNQTSEAAINGGAGSVTVLSATGATVTGQRIVAPLSYPSAIAFDRGGTAWVTDLGDAGVTLLHGDGSVAGGLVSAALSFPDAVAVDAEGRAWVGNMSLPTVAGVSAAGKVLEDYAVGEYQSAVAVDGGGQVWTANYSESTVGLVSVEEGVLSGAGFTGGGLSGPAGLAIDGAGSAWVSNYGGMGVTELAGSASAQPGVAISPESGWAPDAGMARGYGIAIDAAGGVWVASFTNNTVTELVGAATPVQTPLLGPVQVP